jgi:hypothetical protein
VTRLTQRDDIFVVLGASQPDRIAGRLDLTAHFPQGGDRAFDPLVLPHDQTTMVGGRCLWRGREMFSIEVSVAGPPL